MIYFIIGLVLGYMALPYLTAAEAILRNAWKEYKKTQNKK